MDILRDFFLKKNLDTTFMSVEYKNSGALYLSRVSPSSRRSAFQCFASARLPLPFCEVLWPFTSLRRAWRLLRRLDSTVGRPTSAKDGDRACYCAYNLSHLYTVLLQAPTSTVCLCVTAISNRSTYLLDRPCFLLFSINQMKQNGSWCNWKPLCVQ